MNDSDPTHSPLFAGGLYCVGASAPNNLIDGNFAGSQTQPNAQIGGNCALGNSLVSDGSVDMHYVVKGGVGPMAGGNYRLKDSGSPAVNVGNPGVIDEDVDGDLRDDGAPDVGADEFKP
jgi:hypothetical protein